MYLDYLHCGELNLPLFVPLYTCESIRERSNRERLDRRRAVSSRRFDVGIDFLFSVALVSFRFTSSLLTRKVRYGWCSCGRVGAHDKSVILMGQGCWCDQATAGGCMLLCWAVHILSLEDFQRLLVCFPGRFCSGLRVWSWLRHFPSKQGSFLTRATFQFSWYKSLQPLKVSVAIWGQQEIEWIKPVSTYGLLCTERGLFSILSGAAQAGSQASSRLAPTLVPGGRDCDFHHNSSWSLNQKFYSDFLCKISIAHKALFFFFLFLVLATPQSL